MKSAVYQYLVGVPPFDGDDRDDRLKKAVADVTTRARDFAAEVVLVDCGADLPSISSIEDYVDQRAHDRDVSALRGRTAVSRVGITGHTKMAARTATVVEAELRRLLAAMGSPLVGVRCPDPGADQLFAHAVLDLGGRA